MKKMKYVLLILTLVLFALTPILPITLGLTVNIPAGVQYSNIFGSHATLAETVSTLPEMSQQITDLQTALAQQFPPSQVNYNTTYNSGWYWDYTYQNSLAAEVVFLNAIQGRIAYYEHLLASDQITNSTVLNDIYNQAVTNLRNEMQGYSTVGDSHASSGYGLDTRIQNAWMLRYHPLAYWDTIYLLILIPVLVALAIISAACTSVAFDKTS